MPKDKIENAIISVNVRCPQCDEIIEKHETEKAKVKVESKVIQCPICEKESISRPMILIAYQEFEEETEEKETP
jgi:endogenous inhibitor of DNA gyrase (YacG/DUF329 family)